MMPARPELPSVSTMTTSQPLITAPSSGRLAGARSEFSSDRAYWIATGLLCLIFFGSAVWELADPVGSKVQMAQLGYPTYFLYPLAFAKIAGVAVILSRRSRTLSTFAYAGMVFDLILALSAHVAHRETYGVVAASTIVLWIVAFTQHLRRFPAAPLLA